MRTAAQPTIAQRCAMVLLFECLNLRNRYAQMSGYRLDGLASIVSAREGPTAFLYDRDAPIFFQLGEEAAEIPLGHLE